MITNVDIKTLLINAMTALGMALVLELLISAGLSYPTTIPDFLLPYFRNYYNSSDRNIFQVTDCAEYDPDFYYRFKPGDCAFFNREFDVDNHFNSAGLRDDERSLENPAYAIFGDSFTMGWGVGQSESFPEILEALSQRKVLNAGVSSFGTAREVKLLNKLDIRKNATIIFQYHPNDFEENIKCIENNFILPISPRHLYDSLKQNIADRNRYFPFKYLSGVSKSIILSKLRPEKNIQNDTLEARMFLDIILNSAVKYLHSRMIVFRVDTNGNGDGFVNAVDNLLRQRKYAQLNIQTLRLRGIFNKEDYFILDSHLNSRGHAKLGALLWDHLKTLTPSLAERIPVSRQPDGPPARKSLQ